MLITFSELTNLKWENKKKRHKPNFQMKNSSRQLCYTCYSHSTPHRQCQWNRNGAQRVETVWNRRIQFVDKNLFPKSSGVSDWVGERANERSGAREWSKRVSEHSGVQAQRSASKASSAEQANKWAARANERAEKRMARYSTRRFQIVSTHCGTCRAALM